MSSRVLALLIAVVLPGATFTGISTYYLFPEWVALTSSNQNYQRLSRSPAASVRDLDIAQAAEIRHRINCFAEGMGVLLGGVIVAVGIHGICTLPRQ